MARSRRKIKGRIESGRFVAMPHAVLMHPDYVSLPSCAKVLLVDIALQYNGKNNGDLTATWIIMAKRGWRSKTTLTKALRALIENNFIQQTRTGQFMNPGKQCALYAITWQAVDDCEGKRLEINSTRVALRSFK